MKRDSILIGVAFMVALGLVGTGPAFAADLPCDGADIAGHCDITALHILAAGTYTTPAASPVLHINGGELRVAGGATLTLNIAGSASTGLIIENGGKITGNTTGTTGVGATININVANGDIILAASGATISAANTAGGGCGSGHGGVINIAANGENAKITTEDGTTISVNGDTCSAGAINISAPNKGSIDIDGDVVSQSLKSGSGTANSAATPPVGGTQQPGGGPIFITAACNLTISDTGLVSSMGRDPGADLVHLQGGCDVLINGKVESTGVGHAIPGNPPNSCSNVIPHAGSVRRNPATRSGKPFNSTACVEVWAGNSLIINRTIDGLNGEINADTGASPGGSVGTSWIDLFARGDIKILNTTALWAVHANGNAGTDNGGVVTVKTTGVNAPATSPGKIILNGLALQASARVSGPGGTVDVEGILDVDLRAINVSNVDGKVQAKGGTGAPGDQGGHIIIFSQANILAGTASNLDVTGHKNSDPDDGTVDLEACGTIAFPPGTITPAGAIITKSAGVCPPAVTLPTEYVVVLPDCPCGETPNPGDCEKASVKSVLNNVTGRFPSNLGPDLTFRLDLGHDEDGNTSIQQSIDNVTDKNGDGYLIILVVKDGTGQLGGSTVQKVDIHLNYTSTFALFGCSVTLIDPNTADGLPAGLIEAGASSPAHVNPAAPGNIFVMDLHGSGSEVAGWKVVGNGRYMRNVATNTSRIGMWFVGNGNTMHNGNGIDNTGVGIQVDGNSNLVDSSDAFGNGGCGIAVTGNSNTVKKTDVGDRHKGNGAGICVAGNSSILSENDVFANAGNGITVTGDFNQLPKNNVGDAGDKGNGGDGINVIGKSNIFTENDVFNSGGDGIVVTGNSNTFAKNVSGEKGKANVGDGFHVAGAGNSLTENKASANGGDGFDISGGTAAAPGANSLKNNQSNTSSSGSSGENGGAEYLLLNYVKNNGGGNKADGTTVPTATKCNGTFPATNLTGNFTTAGGAVCE